jgi:putative solute:sodium symporter small subunit
MSAEDAKQAYWRRIGRLSAGMIVLLAALTLILPLFMPALNAYRFLRFPLGYFLLGIGSPAALAMFLYGFLGAQRKNDRAYNVTIQF